MAQPPGHGPQYGQRQGSQYGPPQQQFQSQQPFRPPRKKGKLGWVLGGVGVATALIVAVLFAGCASVASLINNGGSHEAKARAMTAKADNLPESDWQLVGRSDPKVESGCLSIDIPCVRLSATWAVPHRVGLADAASRLGMKTSGPPMGLFSGCLEDKEKDGSTSRVCIEADPALDDTWRVSINLTAK